MTHLKIELNNIQENVNSIVIEKLYEIASNGDLDASSNLSGLLHVPVAYKAHALYLTTMFPLLTIAADDYAIPFEDPAMVTYLNSIGVGSNGVITESQAAAATVVANSVNTTVTKFNELKYFTSITESRSGWTGGSSGWIRFRGWTALQEIDISNFTSLGHNNGGGWEDTFYGCTSLTTVKASNKLTKIGNHAFDGCNKLLSITGLDGVIEVYGQAFSYCTKLPSSIFANCQIKIVGGTDMFVQCDEFTTITLSNDCTSIPQNCFYNCDKLTTVVSPGVTSIGHEAFRSCTRLVNINLSNVITVGSNAFYENTSLVSVDLSSCTSIGSGAFSLCTSLTLVILNSSISAISPYTFLNCRALTTVTELGNNTLTVGPYSFLNCESINFPNIITIYPTTGNTNSSLLGLDVVGTFNGCKLNKVVLAGGDLNLGVAFMSNCSTLNEVQGLDKIKYLSGGAFYNNPLLTGTLNFPNCVGSGTRNNGSNTPHNYLMFYNVGATRIELPLWDSTFRDQWALLSDRAFFSGCPNLTTVLIHVPDNGFPNYRNSNSTRSVLFSECPNMTTLIINNLTVPALKNTNDVVQPIDIGGTGVTLYVPDAIVNDYKTATGWSNIASLIKGISELPT